MREGRQGKSLTGSGGHRTGLVIVADSEWAESEGMLPGDPERGQGTHIVVLCRRLCWV